MKGPYCSLCEYALTTVDQMLKVNFEYRIKNVYVHQVIPIFFDKDNKNEKEIEQVLDVVCFHLT